MTDELFNDELLKSFISNFYGYGNYKGKYWFVGLEQGGGNSFNEIEQRLNIWAQNNKPELEDAAEYHNAIGLGHFFDATKPKQQSTWARLIRTIYGFEGNHHTDILAKQVSTYQRDKFLRRDSDSCSIELLPLPSPSMNDWLYAKHSTLDELQSRKRYREQFSEQRATVIRRRIVEYRPQLVMFYGLHPEYRVWWEKIANQTFSEKSVTDKLSAEFAFNEHTVFIISRHPVAHGTTNEYWHNVGRIAHGYLS